MQHVAVFVGCMLLWPRQGLSCAMAVHTDQAEHCASCPAVKTSLLESMHTGLMRGGVTVLVLLGPVLDIVNGMQAMQSL